MGCCFFFFILLTFPLSTALIKVHYYLVTSLLGSSEVLSHHRSGVERALGVEARHSEV